MSWATFVWGFFRRRWWGRFHPFVRWGWIAMKLDARSDNHDLTNVGIALIVAGFASRFIGKREHLYSGGLEPGQQMKIVVQRRGVRTERLIQG